MAALFPNTRCTEPGLADVPLVDFDFVIGPLTVLPVPDPILDVPDPYLPIDPVDVPVPSPTITSLTISVDGFLTVFGPTNFYTNPVIINTSSSLIVYGPSTFNNTVVFVQQTTFNSLTVFNNGISITGGDITINNQTVNTNTLIKIWAVITARYEVDGQFLYDANEAEPIGVHVYSADIGQTWRVGTNPVWERNNFRIEVGEHVELEPVNAGAASILISGADEDWSVTVQAGGGSFTLSVTIAAGTETTAPIAYEASAATVQAAVELLANVGGGNVIVAGDGHPGNPYTLTFAVPLDPDGLTASELGLEEYASAVCDYEGGETDVIEVVTDVTCENGTMVVTYGNITFDRGGFRGMA